MKATLSKSSLNLSSGKVSCELQLVPEDQREHEMLNAAVGGEFKVSKVEYPQWPNLLSILIESEGPMHEEPESEEPESSAT